MYSHVIYTNISSFFSTNGSLHFCATAEQAAVFGSVQSTVPCMQEVLEHSMQSAMLSITISSHIFKDSAMREEECPLQCKSVRVHMHPFLESTPCLNSPLFLPDAAHPRPSTPLPARPELMNIVQNLKKRYINAQWLIPVLSVRGLQTQSSSTI